MPVIAALKLDDLVPPGKSSCSTNSTHYCLCAGVYHTHHFYAGNDLVNQFCHFHFQCRGSTVTQAIFQLIPDSFQHNVRIVSQNHRPPGADIIDIDVAVLIVEVLVFGTLNKPRRTAHRLKRPHRRIDTAGHQFLGTVIQRLGMSNVHLFHYPILPSRMYFASSIAKYVIKRSAPARYMQTADSQMTASRSI